MKRLRRGTGEFARTCRDALIVLTIGGFLSAVIGQICADQIALISALMYLPLPAFALAVLLIDALRKGRTLRGPRFTLAVLGLIAIACATPSLLGLRGLDDADPAKPRIRLLQWNVMWGGSFDNASSWDGIERRIVESGADLIVLSEVPVDEARPRHLRSLLGDGWHVATHNYTSRRKYYWSRTRVFSRHPVRVLATRNHDSATAALVQVDGPTPLRVLVVDGIPGIGDKTEQLHFFALAARELGDIDLVCGDFNAISQSHGFAALRELGYRDASEHGAALRPTWPSIAPIYQLDHVLLAKDVKLLEVDTFFHVGSDHRGTIVDLQK